MTETKITELKKLRPTRLDGVKSPANGFPILVMKAVDAHGEVDEAPDVACAEHVLQLLAQLIQSEAAEMAVGEWDESCDIAILSEAISLMKWFLCNEQNEMVKSAFDLCKAHRKFSADERKRLASEGKALEDGSYPIPDEDALHRAAILARSGHGDVAAAKRLIAKRAKELGVANPLDADGGAQKDVEPGVVIPDGAKAPANVPVSADEPENVPDDDSDDGEGAEGKSPNSSGAVKSQDDEAGSEVDRLIKEAVAEANKSHEEALKELRDELAKVKATPIPGGPAITAPAGMRDDRAKADSLAKAIRYERLADEVHEPEMKTYYRNLAKQARAAAGSPSPS